MSIFTDIQKLAIEVRDAANRIESKQDVVLEKQNTILTQTGLLHSRLDFLEAKVVDANADLKLILNKLNPSNPPPFDDGRWRGNFLALPDYPFAFMYPAWDEQKRLNFCQVYSKAGFNRLPISAWASYAGLSYDYSSKPDEFRKILSGLKSFGIDPVFFVITDAVNDNTKIGPDKAENFCNSFLPKIRDLVKFACLGWELNQVKGWDEHDDPRSGEHMLNLSKYIKWNLPTAKLYAHFQPNWWAPHYEKGDEWTWWRDALSIDGLLHQIRPDAPIELTGNLQAPDGLYLALKYPVPGQPHIEGIKGRMEQLGKKYILFEHSRELRRWEIVRDICNQFKIGYC